MKINTVDTVIQDFREGQNIFRRPSVELMVREISRLNNRIAELEQERRWIPVSERLPEEDGYYYVVIELSGKRFFTELYYFNSQSKVKWFFENSCTGVTTFFDNVVYWTIRPQPPQEGE